MGSDNKHSGTAAAKLDWWREQMWAAAECLSGLSNCRKEDAPHWEAVMDALAEGVDPRVVPADCSSLVFHAARCHHSDRNSLAYKACERALDKGADVAFRKAEASDTPLHYAVVYAHPDLVKLLIDRGAGLDVQDERGDTPLHLAAGLADDQAYRPGLPNDLSFIRTAQNIVHMVEAGASLRIHNRRGEIAPQNWGNWIHTTLLRPEHREEYRPALLLIHEQVARCNRSIRESWENFDAAREEREPVLARSEDTITVQYVRGGGAKERGA